MSLTKADVCQQVDLSTLEAEATLDLWEHQLERLRNEASVRTITRELHMAQSVPAVRIRAFKNGEGSRGKGEVLIGSSIHGVCVTDILFFMQTGLKQSDLLILERFSFECLK